MYGEEALKGGMPEGGMPGGMPQGFSSQGGQAEFRSMEEVLRQVLAGLILQISPRSQVNHHNS